MGKKSIIIEAKETHNQVVLSFKKPTLRYVNLFLRSKCAPDMLSLELFPNTKEITESFGMYHNVVSAMGDKFYTNDYIIVSVGDGSTPRTGATFAFKSKHEVHSIDPAMKTEKVGRYSGVKRLNIHCCNAQDVSIDCKGLPVIVVGVHSHATVEQSIAGLSNYSGLYFFGMQCCVPLKPKDGDKWDMFYENTDWGIYSPERTVQGWKMEVDRYGCHAHFVVSESCVLDDDAGHLCFVAPVSGVKESCMYWCKV